MASSAEQSSDIRSLSIESVNGQAMQTTAEIAPPKRAPPRFEAFPPEVRNEIYRNLLSAEACKVEKIPHITYVFHTAILRTNRQISQEAHAVLYNDNLLVLVAFHKRNPSLFSRLRAPVAFNHVPGKAPLPSSTVRIMFHYDYDGLRMSSSNCLIVAATDLRRLLEDYWLSYGRYHAWIVEIISLLALPKSGWTTEKLSDLIWQPLKALEGNQRHENELKCYGRSKVIDHTGVFEEPESESERDVESQVEEDTDTKDDSDGSESDGNDNDTDSSTMGGSDDDGDEGTDSDEDSSDEIDSDELSEGSAPGVSLDLDHVEKASDEVAEAEEGAMLQAVDELAQESHSGGGTDSEFGDPFDENEG